MPHVDSETRKNRLTVPLGETSRLASASTATIVAISFTSVFVSRALVDFDRSRESFTRRQGCFDTCTLAGRGAAMTRKCGRRAHACPNGIGSCREQQIKVEANAARWRGPRGLPAVAAGAW